MDAGETLRRRGGHLWIVISDPRKNRCCVVAVNLSTVRGKHYEDLSCVLDVGDHPLITQESYVVYGMAWVKTDSELERMIGGGGYISEIPVSVAVLQKLRFGAAESQDTPIGVLEILEEQGFA